jgi:hypothetical protein
MGMLLAALTFFLLVVPQRTQPIASSVQQHGQHVRDMLASVHERYTVRTGFGFSSARGQATSAHCGGQATSAHCGGSAGRRAQQRRRRRTLAR